MDQFVKAAYSAKGNSLRFMKGEQGVQLPLEVFLKLCKQEMLEGALKNIMSLTCTESTLNND